jgi:hypothetical protein
LAQRERVIAFCDRLEQVEDIRELGKALRIAEPAS